jgi:hypothetical protein
MEIILQRLESEPNFHRRIDLFFLVDSIAQLSASTPGVLPILDECIIYLMFKELFWIHFVLFLKSLPSILVVELQFLLYLFAFINMVYVCVGVTGAAFPPAVQAALPRLVHAAAPPGNVSRDNRRQCLRVSCRTIEKFNMRC